MAEEKDVQVGFAEAFEAVGTCQLGNMWASVKADMSLAIEDFADTDAVSLEEIFLGTLIQTRPSFAGSWGGNREVAVTVAHLDGLYQLNLSDVHLDPQIGHVHRMVAPHGLTRALEVDYGELVPELLELLPHSQVDDILTDFRVEKSTKDAAASACILTLVLQRFPGRTNLEGFAVIEPEVVHLVSEAVSLERRALVKYPTTAWRPLEWRFRECFTCRFYSSTSSHLEPFGLWRTLPKENISRSPFQRIVIFLNARSLESKRCSASSSDYMCGTGSRYQNHHLQLPTCRISSTLSCIRAEASSV